MAVRSKYSKTEIGLSNLKKHSINPCSQPIVADLKSRVGGRNQTPKARI